MMGTECITATLSDDSEPSIPPGFGPLSALAFQGIQKDTRPADSHPIPVQVLQSVKEHVESLEYSLIVGLIALGDLEQDPVASIYVEKLMSGVVRVELHAGSEVLKSWPSFKKKRKKLQRGAII